MYARGGSFAEGYYPTAPYSTVNPLQPGFLTQGMILVAVAAFLFIFVLER